MIARTTFPFIADYIARDDVHQLRQPVRILERFSGRYRIQALQETKLHDIERPIQAGQTANVRVESVHRTN